MRHLSARVMMNLPCVSLLMRLVLMHCLMLGKVDQVEAPDWTLILWMWEKAKISSMARTGAPAASVLSARFAPGDSGIISVLGTNFLRMLRCVDGTLKTGVQPLSKRDPQEYLSQVRCVESVLVVHMSSHR